MSVSSVIFYRNEELYVVLKVKSDLQILMYSYIYKKIRNCQSNLPTETIPLQFHNGMPTNFVRDKVKFLATDYQQFTYQRLPTE